jgi:hypothetical protein
MKFLLTQVKVFLLRRRFSQRISSILRPLKLPDVLSALKPRPLKIQLHSFQLTFEKNHNF